MRMGTNEMKLIIPNIKIIMTEIIIKELDSRINKVERKLRKLFEECRSEPEVHNEIYFPPINGEPCKWWRSGLDR
jgi:hypothetical protein